FFYLFYVYSFLGSRDPRVLHSFPTRRSSDLACRGFGGQCYVVERMLGRARHGFGRCAARPVGVMHDDGRRCHRGGSGSVLVDGEDRKSTRLNSSHVKISYAVFCLKKKKKKRH